MSGPRDSDRPRPWYREVWPWLLMLPPVASVAGGVTMVILASGTPAALVVDDYARIEELTSERFERDRRATALGLAAELGVESAPARVELRLHAAPGYSHPATLRLVLRHATNPAADHELELGDVGGAYAAPVELLPGRYRVEVLPPDGSWRLAGQIARLDERLLLRPQGGPTGNAGGAPVAGGR